MISQSESVPPHSDRHSGFTLIEVIVVLAILGLALVLVVGYKPPWSSGLGLKGTAAELASGLRLARSEAIASNRSVVLDTGAERRLPGNVSIELLTIAGEREGAGTGDIRFNPDGSSTGGRIALGDGRQRLAIGVDWLTGRISVADVR